MVLGARRVIAVYGKTLRGSGHGEQDSRYLLAAFDHAHGMVLGQVDVDTDIAWLRQDGMDRPQRQLELLGRIDSTGLALPKSRELVEHMKEIFKRR